MSALTGCDCPCPNPEVVAIPGTSGAEGAAGAAGADGVGAYTYTNGIAGPFDKTGPTATGITITVLDGTPLPAGMPVIIKGVNGAGTLPGYFTVTASLANQLTLTYLNVTQNSDAANIPNGALITIGNPMGSSGTLPNVLADNSTGVASDTVAVGAGKFIHSVYFSAPLITGAVLLYTYTPGFAFKIYRISASVVGAMDAAKAATLTTAIGGTPTTGGVVVMSGAYSLGAQQASSAAITAANTGTSASAITVTASSVTPYGTGAFILHFEMQNMDTANAIASLAADVNALTAALS